MNYRTALALLACTLGLPSATNAQTQIIAGWEEQIFPSYLLSTSTAKRPQSQLRENQHGDPWGLFGVVVHPAQDNTPIKVSIQCEEFFELSEYSCVLPHGGQQHTVFPKVKYRFDKLRQCRQATPATVMMRISIGSDPIEEITSVVTFRSINDCPFLWIDGDNATLMGLNFAAYVNEQHPFVDKLLREALDIGVVDRFVGYQEKNTESVIRQVYALWDLMVSRDVRYSSITTTSASSNIARSQHVRLIEETVNNTQANCVDGSVLFVSLLRKIGFHAALVLVPGHCYVGLWLDESQQHLVGLETTLIDSVDQHHKAPRLLTDSVSRDLRGEQSWHSFVDAFVLGTHELKSGLERQTEDPLEFSIIDIAQARQNGILPIPYSHNEKFLAFDFSEDDEYEDDEYEDDEYEDDDAEWDDSQDDWN